MNAATDSYREEQDVLAPLLHACCEVADSKDNEAQVGKLYKRYAEWADYKRRSWWLLPFVL